MKKKIKRILNLLTGWKPVKNKFPLEKDIKKILIISLFFKGDFLFHTAFIEALKLIYPDVKLDIWIKSRLEDIVTNDTRFNEILVYDNIKTASYRDESNLDLNGKIKFLRKLRNKKYDLIFDLTGKYSTALFTLFSNSGCSIGINYNYFGFCYDKFIYLDTSTTSGHLIEKYLSIIPDALQMEGSKWNNIREGVKPKPYIYIDDLVRKNIDDLLNNFNLKNGIPLIVLHATSGWKAKELGSDVFAELVIYLDKKGYNYIFIGDDGDLKKLSEIQNLIKKTDIILEDKFIKLSFLHSAELIRRADLFIGSDSAPLHTAGAVNTRSIGIFGPTNPEFSKPLGDFHYIIYHELACSASIDKQYCTRDAGFTCPSIDCMKLVNVNEIINLINKILG